MLNKAMGFLKENLFCDCKVSLEDSKFGKLDKKIFGIENKKNLFYGFMLPGTTFGGPELKDKIQSSIGEAYTSTEALRVASASQEPGFWEGINENLKAIARFCDYITHPTKILLALWNWTIEMSFILCLGFCLFSIIMYLCGIKKFNRYIPLAIVIYTILQFINMFVG